MARGSQAKEVIWSKLKEVFPELFIVGKEYRIPMIEDGETIEIKVTLTAAKDVIGGAVAKPSVESDTASPVEVKVEDISPTPEEMKEVRDFLKELDL